ncbi:unnamed protein product [Symbiodinium necroappetens]|uniref:Uncharacterized protein n=1 Tax=Symbiodinium necroappetens TaxID=1628268 RepID=A0A812YDT5_9DINO|nr:unnamed protein product [Symbiodinium necroappetens]
MDEQLRGLKCCTDADSGPSVVSKLCQEPAETVLEVLPPRVWTSEHVHLFFEQKLGTANASFDVMIKMAIDELEELQGVADKICKGSASKEAQQVALEWKQRSLQMLAQRRTRDLKVQPKKSLQANLPNNLQIPTRSKSQRRQHNLRAPRQRTTMKLLRSQVLLKIDDPEACNARRWRCNEAYSTDEALQIPHE